MSTDLMPVSEADDQGFSSIGSEVSHAAERLIKIPPMNCW